MYSHYSIIFFFFNDTATTEIYTLSLHDALPILPVDGLRAGRQPPRLLSGRERSRGCRRAQARSARLPRPLALSLPQAYDRSEEHTSELQSPCNIVCRLLLEKKKTLYHLLLKLST